MNEIIDRLRQFDADIKNGVFGSAARVQDAWNELNLLASMVQVDASYEISELELRQLYGSADPKELQEYKDHRKFTFSREVFQTIHSNPTTHNLSEEETTHPDVKRVKFKMWIVPFKPEQ